MPVPGDSYDYYLFRTEEGHCHVGCDVPVFPRSVCFWNLATLYACHTCSWGMLMFLYVCLFQSRLKYQYLRRYCHLY